MVWKVLVADSFSDAATLSRWNISMYGNEMVSSGEFNIVKGNKKLEFSMTRTWVVLQRCFAICGFDFISRRRFFDSQNLIRIDERGIIFIKQLLIGGCHDDFFLIVG